MQSAAAAATGFSGASRAVSGESKCPTEKKKIKKQLQENKIRKFRRKSCWRFVKSRQINYIYVHINDFLLLKNFEATKNTHTPTRSE